jgi:hypothetical protein
VFWLALILTFSPEEKEQNSHVSGFADDRVANPIARISVRRRTILLLLGEKAGMREVVKHSSPQSFQDGKLECFFAAP